MSKNDLSMAYRVQGGVGRRRSDVLQEIIGALGRGEQPRGLNVTWKWRNTETQDMREAPFDVAIAESRPAFVGLMRRRLERDLSRAIEAEQAAGLAGTEGGRDAAVDGDRGGAGGDRVRPGRARAARTMARRTKPAPRVGGSGARGAVHRRGKAHVGAGARKRKGGKRR